MEVKLVREGFQDLDGFSHAILLYHFHRSKGDYNRAYLKSGPGDFHTQSITCHIKYVIRIRRIEGNRCISPKWTCWMGPRSWTSALRSSIRLPSDVSGWIEKHSTASALWKSRPVNDRNRSSHRREIHHGGRRGRLDDLAAPLPFDR